MRKNKDDNLFERIRNAPPLDRKGLMTEFISSQTSLFEMETLVLQNRCGGLNPEEEEARRLIFNAKMEAQILFFERLPDIKVHEWKEPIPGGGIMNWRMEEKENGDKYFTMSADVRFAIAPLPPGDPNGEPYTYTPTWPIDPNAPIIDDEDDWEWLDED